MAVTQKVTLYNNKFTVPPVINAVQNDTDRQVEAYFGDFTLQVGMTGKLSFIRSDGTHYEVSATLSTANNTATAELDQALTQAGVTQAQLKITDSGNVGSTFTFMIKVQPDVAGISQQQDGYSVEEIVQRLSDAEDAIEDVEDDVADLQGKEYDYAPVITDTASGSIANFPDGADGYPMRSVVAEINPVQSGSGDPSPDNIRPISGFTGANVTRTGKNLLNVSNMRAGNFDTAGSFPNTNVASATYIPVKGGDTYTWSQIPYGVSGGRYVRFYDINKVQIDTITIYSNSAYSYTAPSNAMYCRYLLYRSGGFSSLDVVLSLRPQIELGLTATSYEPYNGNTYTIPLGRTVYGGTVDAVRGKLTDGKGRYVITGNESWTAWGSAYYCAVLNPYGVNDGSTVNCISSMLQSKSTGDLYSGQVGVGVRNNSVYIDSGSYADRANLVGMEIVYDLATPVEYDLTAEEIKSLLGENNVWTDTNGNITVAYCADTKLYIDKKLSEL